jgi:hypothetical protein
MILKYGIRKIIKIDDGSKKLWDEVNYEIYCLFQFPI